MRGSACFSKLEHIKNDWEPRKQWTSQNNKVWDDLRLQQSGECFMLWRHEKKVMFSGNTAHSYCMLMLMNDLVVNYITVWQALQSKADSHFFGKWLQVLTCFTVNLWCEPSLMPPRNTSKTPFKNIICSFPWHALNAPYTGIPLDACALRNGCIGCPLHAPLSVNTRWLLFRAQHGTQLESWDYEISQ